ncbi:MAG: acetate/propionate family kinase [Acetobacteraceae bacterium]|nr:acetate/propionate family kinase [Acetobacteraceae bacterium]
MSALVAVINAGSSSLKFSLHAGEEVLLSGQVDGLGTRPASRARDAAGRPIPGPGLGDDPPATAGEAMRLLTPWLAARLGGRPVAAYGHRVVHGGARHAGPERVTPGLLEELEALVPLAPLHEPHNLAPIRALMADGVPQVACFDTAFHRTVPEEEQLFALPAEFAARGIRRYGFHGLSYEYIASRLPEIAPRLAAGRVIVAHLGSGASLCALRGGRSVATTMGFSALDGLPMGTRCGELDAGVVLHLIAREGMSPAEVQDLLYRRSGLLGLSGLSSDVRDLLATDAPAARLALAVFAHRTARAVGALAATLGGLDGLVFTAGIGENAAPVRAAIMARCAWLGLDWDAAANAAHGPCLSRPGSRVEAHVVPTDENRMIARHTRAALGL